MIRALLIAGLLLLAVAPLGAAQAPPAPEVRNFDDAPAEADVEGLYGPTLNISLGGNDPNCEGSSDGFVDDDPEPSAPGDQVADADCQPTYTIAFDDPQAHVSLRARAEPAVGTVGAFRALALAPTELTISARQSGGVIVDSETVATEDFTWTPLTVASADGAAVIDSVQVSSQLFFLLLDDLTFAREPQPDTAIAGGPEGTTSSTAGGVLAARLDRRLGVRVLARRRAVRRLLGGAGLRRPGAGAAHLPRSRPRSLRERRRHARAP